MILHHEFIKVAKKQGKKLAVRDRTTGRDVTYDRALIGSLILSRRFIKIKGEFIGLMIPTSAGSFTSISTPPPTSASRSASATWRRRVAIAISSARPRSAATR